MSVFDLPTSDVVIPTRVLPWLSICELNMLEAESPGACLLRILLNDESTYCFASKAAEFYYFCFYNNLI
jgi:hypothetical protein